MKQNIINHILFVIDRSGSMGHLRDSVIRVFDAQIAYLAKRSQELDQETRVTVFQFGSDNECIVYDKDVLRLPSLRDLYRIDGMTALIDATIDSITDLRATPEKYGDHAFLAYVLTDGMENESTRKPPALVKLLSTLPDNWTVAVLVPDQNGVFEAKKFGFPPDNISIWSTTTKGVEEVGKSIRASTEAFMTGRTKGIRRMTNVFALDLSSVSTTDVKRSLTRLQPSKYKLLEVKKAATISDFVQANGMVYQKGCAFYQLTKSEIIQDYKGCFVRDRKTGDIYGGDDARQVLGLPDSKARITPVMLGQFDVFIQSTSYTRKLAPGTSLLVVPGAAL